MRTEVERVVALYRGLMVVIAQAYGCAESESFGLHRGPADA